MSGRDDDRARPPGASTPLPAARVRGLGASTLVDLLALTARPEILSFAVGLPDPRIFDVAQLRAAYACALADDVAGANLQYSAAEGMWPLREALAARLTARGLATEPDELLITTGSQQGLTLVALMLLDPGSTILVEDPTYLSALEPFRLVGARTVPVATDEDGVIPQALDAAIEAHAPAAVYLVPTFANPTGRTLTGPRRREVADIVARRGVWLVEDDPYAELRYSGQHLLPISAASQVQGQTMYLGTFSKIGCPGLRLGWMRVPRAVMPALSSVKQAADMHTSSIDQAAVLAYLRDADLDAHIETVRGVYAQRRDVMLAAMPDTLPEGSTWTSPDGGMFLWARLPPGYDATTALRVALQERVAFVPGAPFYADATDPRTLRMCFVTYEPSVIAEGMARLARAFRARLT
ncbi:MAG: PLP-dependent aminotransferase family protein [Austwickia sp.]|nr:PLP-dependent aminotransferase family protein [Austwickia sp.]MBK8437520.1 PLP-dependent aminotransferase family protein [Austwickia sp.]MBK9102786.1 PLP-dependent aminotransferase family protein [Austwickia sp.]